MRFARRLLVSILLFAAAVFAQELGVGAAKAIITPDLRAGPIYLAGFGHSRTAEGVHDDLYVRCVALADKSATVTLCSADLIGLFYEDVQKIRTLYAAEAPPHSWLIVACTHVHSGPDTLGLWGPSALKSGADSEYLDWVEHRIAATAADAVHHLRPVRLEFGRDDHPLLAQLQSVDRPPYVHDPFLFTMRALDVKTDKPIATLINFSDHPEILGRENHKISADYPHYLCDYIEKHGGGMAIFFNRVVGKVSALGSDVAIQDPVNGALAPDGTVRKAELFGSLIGQLTVRSLKTAKTASIDNLSVAHATVFVPLENDRFWTAIGAGIFGTRRPLYTNRKLDSAVETRDVPDLGKITYPLGHNIRTEVDYVQFFSGHHAFAEIATVPGEIYPELVDDGITRYPGADFPNAPFEPALLEQFHTRYQFIFGVTNDELGYIIPKAEWDSEPPWLENRDKPWYGEVNSLGPDAALSIMNALAKLMHSH